MVSTQSFELKYIYIVLYICLSIYIYVYIYLRCINSSRVPMYALFTRWCSHLLLQTASLREVHQVLGIETYYDETPLCMRICRSECFCLSCSLSYTLLGRCHAYTFSVHVLACFGFIPLEWHSIMEIRSLVPLLIIIISSHCRSYSITLDIQAE